MLSVVAEEGDIYEAFGPHVDAENVPSLPESPNKKLALKTYNEIQALLQSGKKREVKQILRDNAWPLTNTIRSQLWPTLSSQHTKDEISSSESFYWDMVVQLFGSKELPDRPLLLPQFVDPSQCHSYCLTRKGRLVAERVTSVLGYACPDVTYSPVAFSLASLLLHFMPEETCYASMASLMSSKSPTFLTQTKLLCEVTWRTCLQLARKHAKSQTVALQKLCGSPSRLEQLFHDWIWWIYHDIPFPHLVRIADCYLLEGMKVLYRVAIALIALFSKMANTPGAAWEDDLGNGHIEAAMSCFCNNLPVSPSKLLRLAFGLRNFSSAGVTKAQLRTEMALKSKAALSASGGPRQLTRSRSSENLPSAQSQGEVRMASHTLTIREGNMSPEHRSPQLGNYPIQSLHSVIVNLDELLTVWSWLPIRITMYQPVLLYTTEEHGCSLTTFYFRCEQHEPTILIIKTCSGEIFGAYCSSRWQERNLKNDKGLRQTYFGTGETFVFSLSPNRHKYPWVGLDVDQDSDNKQPELDHGSELFMAADTHTVTLGGGGGQAIWLDENVRFGKSEHCTTFNNPPLCSGGDFEIQVLEVYGFSGM